MQKLISLCAAALALALCTPASATPPTAIDIRDEVFGVSEDEVFVLRTVTDNMGSYYEVRFETFLVATSLTTGEQTAWHISSATLKSQFDTDGEEGPAQLEYLPTGQKNDPLAILAARKGLLWATSSYRHPQDKPAPETLEDGSIVFRYPESGYQPDGARYLITKAFSNAVVEKAVRQIAEDIPDYPRHSTISTRDFISNRLDQEWPCKNAAASVGLTPVTFRPVHLVRMTCAYDDTFESTSVLVPARQVLITPPETE